MSNAKDARYLLGHCINEATAMQAIAYAILAVADAVACARSPIKIHPTLIARLRADAKMNLDMPVLTHLQDTGLLELEAAAMLEQLEQNK